MQSTEVHFQIIRIAVGYSILGIFIITAIISILSFIHIRPTRASQPRPLILIEPPWFRKSLYSSLFIQVVVAAALFWKSLLTIDTKTVTKNVKQTVEKQGVEAANADLKNIGILRYWRRSNDFLPFIREAITKANSEIWISGASFYLSLPDNEDLLVDKANKGIKIHYLFLDPYGKNIGAVARTFSQSPEELRNECLITIKFLKRIHQKLIPSERNNLQVRLFDESPRARFYIFDPDDPSSKTFFVPHVNSITVFLF